MLKTRIITALILVPLVFAALFGLPTEQLFWVLTGLMMIGAWEWAGFLKQPEETPNVALRISLPLVTGALFVLVWYSPWRESLILASALGWVLVLVWLRYPGFPGTGNGFGVLLFKSAVGVLLLLGTGLALLALHGNGPEGAWLLLYVMALTWVADTGAYFVGRRFGRVKLAPSISPGKTREGVYGALGFALIYGLLGANYFAPQGQAFGLFVLLVMVTAVFSVVGDLFESLFKRQAGVKDSSQLLPGHGGILDRIDSLTAAAPVFVAGMILF